MKTLADIFCEDYLTYYAIYRCINTAAQRTVVKHNPVIDKKISLSNMNFIDGSSVYWTGELYVTDPPVDITNVRQLRNDYNS